MRLGFSLYQHINKMLSRISELKGKQKEGRENYIMRSFITCNLQSSSR
jgi:hypothetical protein